MAGRQTPHCPLASPCRPWASLLVAGIKRIEGRGWPTAHRGLLWIASTATEPSAADVEEVEALYATVHGLEGRRVAFPEAYPTGVLLGCVRVVDCLTAEQVEGWAGLPESVVMEVGSPFCFLCARPERLVVPQQMRGWPKIFALEKKVHATAKLQRRPAALAAKDWPAWDWGLRGAAGQQRRPPRELQQAEVCRPGGLHRSARQACCWW